MGTNKRYAESIDKGHELHANQIAMRGHKPSTLLPQELELDRLPLTRTPVPERVKVWVHYDAIPMLIDAEMVAWTPRACAVRWKTFEGEEHRAWVWSSAVEKL